MTEAACCDSPALRFCPFCGSDQIEVWGIGVHERIVCAACDATGPRRNPRQSCEHNIEAAPSSLWNLRASPLREIVRWMKAAPDKMGGEGRSGS